MSKKRVRHWLTKYCFIVAALATLLVVLPANFGSRNFALKVETGAVVEKSDQSKIGTNENYSLVDRSDDSSGVPLKGSTPSKQSSHAAPQDGPGPAIDSLLGRGIIQSSITIPPGVPADRRDRFPSFSQRLKMHMGHWYAPPCNITEDVAYYRFFEDGRKRAVEIQKGTMSTIFKPEVVRDKVILFDMESVLGTSEYVDSTLQFLVPWWKELDQEEKEAKPLMLQFGDVLHTKMQFEPFTAFPVLGKARRALTPSELSLLTDVECVQKSKKANGIRLVMYVMKPGRHLSSIFKVDELDAVPWDQKIPKAVFRGVATGANTLDEEGSEVFLREILAATGNGSTDFDGDPQLALNYISKPRFQFCWRYRSSNLFDAGLITSTEKEQPILDRSQLLRDRMGLSDLLKYKAIVVIEGNDVATSLKWVLYSHSVPLMSKPTVVTFAMEELLEPWVHYVPLNADMTDAEEKMQWVLDHDEEARIIAERGRLFIHDFLFHPDAEDENRRLQKEILRRVRTHFRAME